MGRTARIDCIRTQRNSRLWLAARRPLARLTLGDGPSTALPRRLRAETPPAKLVVPRCDCVGLAEDYAELDAAGRNSPAPVVAHSALGSGGQAAGIGAAAVANQRATTDRSCRAASIRYYEALLSNHPSYAELDAVSYYLAYTYERSGDLSNAGRVYLDLISKFQNSHYVPLGRFGLGEIALRESEADPTKLSSARNAYQEVTRWPPPANDAYGWAWVRLAQVLERQDDRKGAKTAYATALAFAQQYPIAPASSGITAAIPSWVQP